MTNIAYLRVANNDAYQVRSKHITEINHYKREDKRTLWAKDYHRTEQDRRVTQVITQSRIKF